jgi:hypothetical protein
VSVSRELREFAQQQSVENDYADTQTAVAHMLGITASNMQDTIISDICNMIEHGFRVALEGYVLCLSRIVSHKTAWRCINEAFAKKGESVPQKYFDLFGQSLKTIPTKSNFVVQK